MSDVTVVETRRVVVGPGVEVEVRVQRPGSGPAAGAADPADPQRSRVVGVVEDAASLPVLAVHGLASNARMWDGVAARLAEAGHTVAAVDQRGHGRSDKPEGGYDFATLTGDLLAVLDDLGWDDPARPPVVAGQSWGGNVAVELAARHPARVGGLVLVDGGTIELSGRFADWPTCEAALAPPAFEGVPYDELSARMRRMHADWPPEGIEGQLANLERLPDGTARPWLSRANHLRILRHLWDHHPSSRWPLLQMPVLVVAAGTPDGGRADAAKREEVDRAVRALPAARAVWVDGDHDLHAQHPDRIASLITTVAAGGTLEA
ncbi:MAG TPA: alpha/beta hydrolase [Acidimicrobiales bacterium]|nr:alpha/beta hydrolase [Acidimicrobiales bacterium]